MSQTPARLAQRKKQRFLETLRRTGNVTAACGVARLPRETAYFWRSHNPEFAEAWDAALEQGLDALEDEVMRRAKDGVEEPVFYKGAVVGETKRYSDTLAMFVLKSKRREVWGDRQTVDMRHDWAGLTVEQRVAKVMYLLGRVREAIERNKQLDAPRKPIVYDPTDGDELAEKERREREEREMAEMAEEQQANSIGR
jgi:hypothetical protein